MIPSYHTMYRLGLFESTKYFYHLFCGLSESVERSVPKFASFEYKVLKIGYQTIVDSQSIYRLISPFFPKKVY